MSANVRVLAQKLGAKKEAAILALLSSRNVEEAARSAAVTPEHSTVG